MSRPTGGRIAAWLDVRSGEERAVLLSFAGSFLAISFLVLGRALREALYLEAFDVRTLPYVTAAVALLSLPVVGRYAAWLARTPPRRVLRRLGFGLGLGLAAMAPFLLRSGVAIVAFYLWTALGALLLTSGFWVVVSEHFPVRGAKRLFGLIGAGGTLGALVTGTSVRWLAGRFEAGFLAPMLVALLALFLLAVSCLPPDPGRPGARAPDAASLTEGLALVRGSPHLRTIAAIVLTATIASTVLDYQFKEIVRSALQTKEELAGFFGAFYGWTGGAALVIQLLIAARLMARAGVARALAVLPLFLLVGSSALFLLPGLAVATLARGGDNALRKSVFRSVLEFLWVPVPSGLRRRTKPILDTAVDSAAEGIGAVIVFLWVTLGGLPSRYLSAFVAGAALLFLGRARFMGRAYATTLRRRLLEEGEDIEHLLEEAGRGHRDLMSATFTRLDITRVLEARGIVPGRGGAEPGPTVSGSAPAVDPEAPKPDASLPADVPTLALALARDALAEAATSALARIGPAAVPDLAALLADEKADFVIRRRIPRALARIPDARADAALLAALGSRRFEVRYRAAAALVHRRSSGLPEAPGDWRARVWAAVREEVNRERPVWELQRLLDGREPDEDGFLARRLGMRGKLSLEHTFRLLSLVVEDPDLVRSAYHGVVLSDAALRGFALEYLEHVLPEDVRTRLWPFIGDASPSRRARALRPLKDVVSDLARTGATLFAAREDRAELRRLVEASGGEDPDDDGENRPEAGGREPD